MYNVLFGQKVVLIPRGNKTCLIASEVVLTYGIVVEVVHGGGGVLRGGKLVV